MKLNSKFSIILILIIALNSCMEEDIPVKPFERGDSKISQVDMEKDYRWQIFYDLANDQELNKSLVNDWDLAFNCSENSSMIMLNSAIFMAAFDYGVADFDEITTVGKVAWKSEPAEGYTNIDSNSIGEWYSHKIGDSVISKYHVYLVDRGVSPIGRPLGNKKMMILGANKDSYFIRISDLNGKKDTTLRIDKKLDYNYIHLSLTDFTINEIEPPAKDWDILFTRYTYIFYEPEYTPYSVTGVLINPNYVEVAIDTVNNFDDISFDLIDKYNFSSDIEAIGYNWKSVDIETSIYTIYPEINYIIKDRLGFYYKLHFIDYYNDDGKRGAPKFEFKSL